jgi:predicted Zn-dependent protease
VLVDDDPRQGVIEGNQFLHPDLRLGFSVPQGYGMQNGSRAVSITGSNGQAQFSTGQYNGNLSTYIGQVSSRWRGSKRRSFKFRSPARLPLTASRRRTRRRAFERSRAW